MGVGEFIYAVFRIFPCVMKDGISQRKKSTSTNKIDMKKYREMEMETFRTKHMIRSVKHEGTLSSLWSSL